MAARDRDSFARAGGRGEKKKGRPSLGGRVTY